MLYAIYLRKSRADLEAEAMGQGETLARHRAALLDYAAHHGLEIGAVYEEIISGESIDARPKMKQLLREVEQGRWAGVLCMDIDRLARGNSADQARVSNTFRISGTLIITPSKVYDQSRESDEEYVDFELFMARREYKAISRRIMRGRIASVKEGHFIGSTPPYGYDKVKVEKGRGFTLLPNSESDTVKQIYSMCISGMGCNAIARRLDMMGVTPRKGSSWSSASIQLSSTIVKFTGRSNISALSFNTERQNELIVLTTELLNLISCSRGIAFSPEFLEASSIARVILVRNSSAALRVNVITANLSALTGGISAASFPRISLTTRSTSRAVLPLPAAADTHAELSDG